MIELKVCDVTTDEQETTVSYGRKEDRAVVYSNDPTVLTKIQKLLNTEGTQWTLDDTYYGDKGVPTGYRFSCPKKMIKFVAKGKQLSEAHRAALAKRLAEARGLVLSDGPNEEFEEEED